jgi:hypothetical protein
MWKLAVALVALGCHGSSTPAGAAQTGDVAELVKLADDACACKDARCRDQIHDRWKARPRNPHDPNPPSTQSQAELTAGIEHDVAVHDAEMRLYGCLEPEHDAATVTARIRAFADRACACDRADTACLDTLHRDFDRYLEVAWLLQDGYTDADRQGLQAEMRRFEICRQVGPTAQ